MQSLAISLNKKKSHISFCTGPNSIISTPHKCPTSGGFPVKDDTLAYPELSSNHGKTLCSTPHPGLGWLGSLLPLRGALQAHVRTPATLACGPRALGVNIFPRKSGSHKQCPRPQVLDPGLGSWNSQNNACGRVGRSRGALLPSPSSLNSWTFHQLLRVI